MKIKLQINGLNFHGNGVPANPRAALLAVQEMVTSVQGEGIEFTFNQRKPLSFSALVRQLEQLGLVRATNAGINPNPPLDGPPVHVAAQAAGQEADPDVQGAGQAPIPEAAQPTAQAEVQETAQVALGAQFRTEVLY